MAKFVYRRSVRLAIAVVLGLLFAAAFTDIKGRCSVPTPEENPARCVEFSKAVMSPSELIHNEQDSLVSFSKSFMIVTVGSYMALTAYERQQLKRHKR